MEPRARAGRHKSTLNFGDDLRQVLVAYGAPTHPDLAPTTQHPDSERYLQTSTTSTQNSTHRPTSYQDSTRFPNPYPETLRVLDEILTDFIIETCHVAVQHATLAGRQKVGQKDFDFVIRRDKNKMGRVQDLVRRQKVIKESKKLPGVGGEEGAKGGKMDEDALAGLAGLAGEDTGTGKGKGRGRGRRRKRAETEVGVDGTVEREGEDGVGVGDGLVGEEDLDVDGDGEGEDDDDERLAKRARSDTG